MSSPALPDTPTRARLDARLSGPGSVARIEADELAALIDETGLDVHTLIRASLAWAQRWAIAPLSSFEVGAAALGSSGRLYLGANIEFRGLPLSQTVHAEQSVIAHAWTMGETGISCLATTAAPCGFCRQFMCELPEPRPVLLLGDQPPTTLDALLPDAFGPRELGREPELLRRRDVALVLSERSDDPLAELARTAAARASAPYTGALSGVALETRDGRRFVGALAESAAYNPTLAPMQAALISAHHGGARFEDIARACLVELDGAPLSQLDSARAVLASIRPGATLERVWATRPTR